MPTVSITTTYDTDTRELRSVATLTGFVPIVPGQVSVGSQIDSTAMAEGFWLNAQDISNLAISARRAIDLANSDLVEWRKVIENPEKAAALVEATAPPEEPPEEPAP